MSVDSTTRDEPHGAVRWNASDLVLSPKADIYSLGCIWWSLFPQKLIPTHLSREYPFFDLHNRDVEKHRIYRILLQYVENVHSNCFDPDIRDIRKDIIQNRRYESMVGIWETCVHPRASIRPTIQELDSLLEKLCQNSSFFFSAVGTKGKNVAIAFEQSDRFTVYSGCGNMVERFSQTDWLSHEIAAVGDGTTGSSAFWGRPPDEHGHTGLVLARDLLTSDLHSRNLLLLGGRKLHMIDLETNSLLSVLPPAAELNGSSRIHPENQVFSLAFSQSAQVIFCGLTWGAVGAWSVDPFRLLGLHYHLPEKQNYVWSVEVDDEYFKVHQHDLFFAGFESALIGYHWTNRDTTATSWVVYKHDELRFMWSVKCSHDHLFCGDGNGQLLVFELVNIRNSVAEKSPISPTRVFNLTSQLLDTAPPPTPPPITTDSFQKVWKVEFDLDGRFMAAIVQDWHAKSVIRIFRILPGFSDLTPVFSSEVFFAGVMLRSLHFVKEALGFVFFDGETLQLLEISTLIANPEEQQPSLDLIPLPN